MDVDVDVDKTQEDETQSARQPVRVVQVEIPNSALSERLFGPGIHLSSCEVIFRHMLPAPPSASLQAVQEHGLVVVFTSDQVDEDQPTGLVIPWSQVSYIRFSQR